MDSLESKVDLILKKIERLESMSSTIDLIVRQQTRLDTKLDSCIKKPDELAKIVVEQNILLQKNLSLTSGRFPVKSDDDLKLLDDELTGENRENLVKSMSRLLCNDLAKNLERIFDSSLISEYNYDGTKGKKALKIYANIITALKDCTSFDTFEKFLCYFRLTVKKVKNRDAKRHSRKDDLKTDSQETEMD